MSEIPSNPNETLHRASFRLQEYLGMRAVADNANATHNRGTQELPDLYMGFLATHLKNEADSEDLLTLAGLLRADPHAKSQAWSAALLRSVPAVHRDERWLREVSALDDDLAKQLLHPGSMDGQFLFDAGLEERDT